MRENLMSEPARRRATYQDVLNAPPEMIAEIFDGELVLHPRPAPPHADTAMGIAAGLAAMRRRRGSSPGGWHLLFEPELHLQGDVVVPDIAGWRRERLPHVPPKSTLLTAPPDWACEILSPSTVRTDRTAKMRTYARHGVKHVWLVDPSARVLEVFQLAGELWQRVAVGSDLERVRVPPFEEVELDLGEWWEEEASSGLEE
jgi:Uma2 family endonuclease